MRPMIDTTIRISMSVNPFELILLTKNLKIKMSRFEAQMTNEVQNPNDKKIMILNYADLVKSLKTVTPAEAGVQNYLNLLDSRSSLL